MSSRPVRLPLQIGSSSLFNLSLGAGLLLPRMLAPVWWAVLLEVGGPLGMNVGMAIPFLLVGLAIGALRRAFRRRASDLVIDQTGVRIEGPSSPCGQSLERSDRVSGRDLGLLLAGPEAEDSWRYVVRRVAPGTNPKLATDGAPLAPGDDYADFVVRKGGVAYLYVDGFYAKTGAAPSADGGPD